MGVEPAEIVVMVGHGHATVQPCAAAADWMEKDERNRGTRGKRSTSHDGQTKDFVASHFFSDLRTHDRPKILWPHDLPIAGQTQRYRTYSLSIAPECCHPSKLKLRFLKGRGGSTPEQSKYRRQTKDLLATQSSMSAGQTQDLVSESRERVAPTNKNSYS